MYSMRTTHYYSSTTHKPVEKVIEKKNCIFRSKTFTTLVYLRIHVHFFFLFWMFLFNIRLYCFPICSKVKTRGVFKRGLSARANVFDFRFKRFSREILERRWMFVCFYLWKNETPRAQNTIKPTGLTAG